jgi:Lrp/AsnC family transcriptional regulator, leucine-responsive regulatory protein
MLSRRTGCRNLGLGAVKRYQARINGTFGTVPLDIREQLDATDEAILRILQDDGRVSTADLARRIALSPSATADHIRRLTDLGVLPGFRADIDLAAVGYPILAFVRLRYPTGNYKPFHDVLDTTPEILEAHHVTGDDCFILKALARSMADLERITGKLATLGPVTTSVVYSTPLQRRSITCAN